MNEWWRLSPTPATRSVCLSDVEPSLNEKCKVLLVTNSVQIGGMEEHVRLLARHLDREKYHVTVAFPDWEPTDVFVPLLKAAADDVIIVTPDRRPGGPGSFREAFRLWLAVRRSGFHVAHLHCTNWEGALLAQAAVRLGGVKQIFITEHLAPDVAQPRWRCWMRQIQLRSVHLICVSEYNRRARQRFMRQPKSTSVVRNGIDTAKFDESIPAHTIDLARHEYGIPAGVPIVGTAIRLEEGKGVGDLVAGFAGIADLHPKARMLVVGDGLLRSDLEAQAEELGIADRTTFTGFVIDPRPLITLMDVFVLPVPFGSASIGLLEAMAMSKACIISFGSEGEAPVPGESGFWAEPHDPSSIAAHLDGLLSDPAELGRIGANARARVEKDFSATRVAQELGDLYLDPGDNTVPRGRG